jgi:HPt (histidine-containing phosphotransfer) domain-containing protein
MPMQITAPSPAAIPVESGSSRPVEGAATEDNNGIDVEGAIRRMGCDEEFYLEIVQMFLKDTGPMPEQLRQHLVAQEHVAAARLLHTLKGVASTVGAAELASQAAQIEDKLKADPENTDIETMVTDIDAGIDRTVILLEQVVRRLNKSEEPSQSITEPPVSPAITQELVVILQMLDRLLRESDMEATAVHSSLSRDRDSAHDEAFGPLDHAMAVLDFTTARRHCASLIQRFNPSV